MFNETVKISESFIAEKLDISEHAVKNNLQILEKKHLVQYYTPAFHPVLIYTKERINSNRLNLNTKSITQRKKTAQNQLHTMLSFVMEENKCRTNIALFYFDETPEKPCGNCDNCLKSQTDSSLQEEIIAFAQQGATLEEIINFSSTSKETTIQLVRVLLDEGILIRKGRTLSSTVS